MFFNISKFVFSLALYFVKETFYISSHFKAKKTKQKHNGKFAGNTNLSQVYSFESRKFENFYFDTKLSSTRLRVLISKKNVFYFEFIFAKVNFENVLRNYNPEIGQSGELKFVQKGDYRTKNKVGN